MQPLCRSALPTRRLFFIVPGMQTSGLRVGLTYDLRQDYLAEGYSLEETAEFDKPDTIEGFEQALHMLGFHTARIGNAIEQAVRGEL